MFFTSLLNILPIPLYFKNLIVATRAGKYLVEMVAVGVGDEYLSKTRRTNNLHNTLHTVGVEFVEDVVEQEQRCCARGSALEEVKLCQFECHGKGFVLSLTALALHLMRAEGEEQVVAMHTMQGIAHCPVLEAVAPDDLA